MNAKPPRYTAAKDLTGGYLRALKARGAEVGVWEIRGRVLSRVNVYARDARLSGAETHILSTIALQLMGLGRTKGMMSVESLADDCMVTSRTVRNGLRALEAAGFVLIAYRASGQMTLRLARRFGPHAPVPGDKSVDNSKRRAAPRKKISTKGTPLRSVPLKDNERNSDAPNGRRIESTASSPNHRTATGNVSTIKTTAHDAPGPKLAVSGMDRNCKQTIERKNFGGSASGSTRRRDPRSCLSASKLAVSKSHDPPRKRAAPVASG